MNFLFVRKNGLLFGATTRFNVSPSTTIELLNRMAKVFKDYCGVLSEVRRKAALLRTASWCSCFSQVGSRSIKLAVYIRIPHPHRLSSHARACTLAQESIRKNFILVYELLDEMMDYGYPQGTSTETLKTFVYNEPVLVESAKPNTRCDSHPLGFIPITMWTCSGPHVCSRGQHGMGRSLLPFT